MLLEPGTRRQGVEHITDAAASAFVQAENAESVRKLLAELARWWEESAAWC